MFSTGCSGRSRIIKGKVRLRALCAIWPQWPKIGGGLGERELSSHLATIHQRYRQDRQTEQRSDSIRRTVLQTVAQKLIMLPISMISCMRSISSVLTLNCRTLQGSIAINTIDVRWSLYHIYIDSFIESPTVNNNNRKHRRTAVIVPNFTEAC